jgi:hypothetical protein
LPLLATSIGTAATGASGEDFIASVSSRVMRRPTARGAFLAFFLAFLPPSPHSSDAAAREYSVC